MKKISGIAFILFMCVMCPFVAQANIFIDTVRTMAGNGTGFCWFCPIFGTLFDAMNTIATNISRDMSQTFLAVMGVALLFSIGFKTAKMLTSLQAVDLMQYLTDMFRHLGRAIIASAFLWASLSIFTYVISPFLTMSLSLSTTIIEAGDVRATITRATQEVNRQANANINTASICNAADDNAQPLLQTEATALDNGTAPQRAFAPSVKAALICLMRTVSASLISGMVVGATIYYGGIEVLVDSIMQIGTALKMICIGAFIVLGHIFIFAAVPFKYIDSMVRMAFVCALMPLWIILWVFPATTGYTKKAWDMFLSTCAIFLCMSVILVLVVQLINAAFEPAVLADVVRYLVADQAKLAAEKFNVSLKNLLVTIIMCFTGYKMLGTATTLASSFIGTIPNLGVGDQMAQSTVKVAQGAKTGAIATGMVAKAGLNKVGAAFGKPDLGNKVAASAGRIAGHTAAAIATGGLSLPISAGMAIHNAVKGKKSAGVSDKYAKKESPKMGAKGMDMGVDPAAMGLTGTKTFNTTENGVTESRTQKSYRDAAGNRLTQTFDKNGNLRSESLTRKDGSTMNKLYDAKGNPTSETVKNADGSTLRRFHDADGVIRTTQRDANNNIVSTTRQKTDSKGNITSETTTDKNGRTTKQFDENGKVRSETHRDNNGNVDTKKYNESEQLVAESHRDKNGQGSDSTHRYDANGKYYGTDIKYTDGAERAVLKDEKGNITGVTQINKDGSSFNTEYKNGEPVKTTHYDKDGNVQSETIHDVKETHRETTERETVRETTGGGSGETPAPAPAPAPDRPAPVGETRPADTPSAPTAPAPAPDRPAPAGETRPADTPSAPAAPAPAPDRPAPAGETRPADTPSAPAAPATPAPAAPSAKDKGKSNDTSKLESKIEKAASDAADAKRTADNAQVTAQNALSAASQKEDEKKKKDNPDA